VNVLLVIEIDGTDLELAAIVGVDEARGVRHGEALAKGKAAPGLDEARIPLRNRDGEPRRDEPPLVGREGYLLAGAKVKSGIAGVGVRRELDRGVEPLDGQKDMLVCHWLRLLSSSLNSSTSLKSR